MLQAAETDRRESMAVKFGKLTGYETDGQRIMLDFEGQEAQIQVLTPYIIMSLIHISEPTRRRGISYADF